MATTPELKMEEGQSILPGSPQHLPQCRFCLEEAPEEDFITPCKCEGTSRFVHESCLRRWQGEALCYEHALVCQVCRSHFTLKPMEKLWRSSKSRSSEETTAALFDNVRTNPRYDRDAISRLPRTFRSRLRPLLDSGSLVLQTPQRARDENLARRGRRHNDNVMIFFEAVLASRMAHWHKGIYLLAAKWENQGTDGSDALVGVNLGGARVDSRGAPEVTLLQEHLAPTTPFQFLVGGPVGPEKFLALVPYEGDFTQPLRSRLVHQVRGDTTCALFGELRDVVEGSLELMAELLRLAPRHFIELPDQPWLQHIYERFGTAVQFLHAAAKISGKSWRFTGPLVVSEWYGRRELWLLEEPEIEGSIGKEALLSTSTSAIFSKLLPEKLREVQQVPKPAVAPASPVSKISAQEHLGHAMLNAPTALIAAHLALRDAMLSADAALREVPARSPSA